MRLRSVLGVAFLTAGTLVLAILGYELYGTGVTTHQAQQDLLQQFDRQPRPHAGGRVEEPAIGRPVAVMRIPRLGAHWRYVVVQGTGAAQLENGPGHIPGTAMPGQAGNVAVAGHRVTYAHPFYDLNEVRAGDRVYLTTSYGRFTYVVTGTSVVVPTDVAVVDPVPGKRLLTLTTCNPRFSARQRLIVRATLIESVPRGT